MTAAVDSVATQVFDEVMFEEDMADVARGLVDEVVEEFEALQSKMRARAESIMQSCNLGLLLGSLHCNADVLAACWSLEVFIGCSS